MDAIGRQQLIKKRSVARGILSRIQTFIESGDRIVKEIQVRFGDLQGIFNRYDNAQNGLEISDETDHTGDRELFENQYYQVETKFNELLHPVVDPSLTMHSSTRSSLSGHSNNTPRSHASSARIKLPTIALPTFEGDTLAGYITETLATANVEVQNKSGQYVPCRTLLDSASQ